MVEMLYNFVRAVTVYQGSSLVRSHKWNAVDQISSLLSYIITYTHGLTAWIAAASLLTLPDVIPATDILPSLVA